MKSLAEVTIPYSVVHEVGDKRFPVQSERCVSLVELGEDHGSKMAFELRIEHHESDDGKGFVGADEVHRYQDEATARAAFEGYVRALAGEKAPALLGPLTVPGRLSRDSRRDERDERDER